MRDFKGMKRQRGRNRGGGGGGGGGKPQHNSNRAFDSNGPEGIKVRGAAQHVYEKYHQLARDAHTAGDRVIAENYLQHAEHYFRVMRAMQPLRPVSDIIGRDTFSSGYDIDFEDESGLAAAAEGEVEAEGGERSGEYRGGEPRRDDRFVSDRYQGDRSQGDRPQGERSQTDRYANDRRPNDRNPNDRNPNDRGPSDRNLNDRPNGNGESYASERNGADRGQRPYRDERPRYRDDRPNRFAGRDSGEAPADPASDPEPSPALARPAANDPILRADDGEVNHAPAFLQVRPQEPRGDGEPRRRRARAPRPLETSSDPATSEADES